MNRNEQQMYSDIASIRKSLEKIANALDNNVLDNVNYKPEINPADLCNVKDSNLPSLTKQEMLEEDDTHNDYLNDLVQGMNQIEYLNFHNDMSFSFASNDSTAMSDAIYELEYEECLGAIQRALLITGDSDYIAYAGGDSEAGRNFVIETLKEESTTQPENDPYTYDNDLIEYKDGVKNDPDYRIRLVASNAEEDYATKKDAILDYVELEFGSEGARYTDVIKFAYYLGAPNAPKYTSENRGYYSCAFSPRMDGHLIQGGKDFLVKGINKDGKERYFAYNSVNKYTDYYKRIQ